MKKSLLFGMAVLTVVLVTSTTYAEQWQIVGPRALGMGGAHVAVVNDATAQYWNPGAFGFFDEPLPDERNRKHQLKEQIKNEKNKAHKNQQEKDKEATAEIKYGAENTLASEGSDREDWNGYSQRYFGMHLSVGGGVQILGDVADEIDEVVDKDFQTLFDKAESDNAADNLSIEDIGNTIDLMNEIKDLDDPDKGVIVMVNSGFAIRIGHCAVGSYVLGEIASNIAVDLDNIGFTSGSGVNAVDALTTDLGAVPGNSPGGLDGDQEAQLVADVTDLSGWNAGQAQTFVDAADAAIAADGRNATAEDIQTIFLIARAASTESESFDNNQTSITFIGPVILEVPLTYGYAVNDYWSIGGNVKYMHGKIFFTKFTVFETDSDDLLADAQRESKESDYFGIDLGTMMRFSDFRIGFVGRNLNEPRFDYETDTGEEKTWRLNPQVRGGIAYMPCDWFTLSADADITRNKTAKEKYFSQLVSTGVEFNIFNFLALRGGFYTNVGDSTDHDEFVYTAGLGLNFWGIHLDAGVAMSESTSELDGQSAPDETRGELALSAQF